jgi:hypothetical protein
MSDRCACGAAKDVRYGGLCHSCYVARVEAEAGKRESKVRDELPSAPAHIETVTDTPREAVPC